MSPTEEIEYRQAFGREVARIEGLPQAKRWRAIKTLLLQVNPDLKPIDRDFVQAIKEQREQEMFKLTGASKSGDTRALYSMPQYLYAALHTLDPEFTTAQEDPELSVKTNRKLAEVFPEYRLAVKI